MKKTFLIIAVLVAAVVIFAMGHDNQGMNCRQGMGQERMEKGHQGNHNDMTMRVMHQLELTEDQQEQLGDQHVKMQKTIIEINSQIKTLEIDAEVARKDLNFSQMKKVSNDIFDLKKELKGKQIDSHEKCWNILTSEQKEEALELMKHPRKMMKERMGEKKGMGHQRNRMMDHEMDDDDNKMGDDN